MSGCEVSRVGAEGGEYRAAAEKKSRRNDFWVEKIYLGTNPKESNEKEG